MLSLDNAFGEDELRAFHERVKRGLETCAFGCHMEKAVSEIENAFRGKSRAKEMQKVAVDRLVAHRIIAVGRRKPLSRRRSGDVAFAIVSKEIADIQNAAVADFRDGYRQHH